MYFTGPGAEGGYILLGPLGNSQKFQNITIRKKMIFRGTRKSLLDFHGWKNLSKCVQDLDNLSSPECVRSQKV